MRETRVVKCLFNDSFSLVWDYENDCYVLTLYRLSGDEARMYLSLDEVQDLADLGKALGDVS